jgi:hypothetical protein
MELSRRAFLAGIGAMGMAGAGGCGAQPEGPVVGSLPDAERLPVPAPVAVTGAPSTAPAGVKAAPAFGTGTFGIYPRSAWTSVGPRLGQIEPMHGVTRITFHHSGDQHNGRDVPFLAEGYRETVQHLELVRQYHTEQRHWADIGYHFAIDRAGRVFQLRSLNYQGAHVAGQDPHNLGIVVLGNFNVQEPTAAQKARILSLGKLARMKYGLRIAEVFTHQEIGRSDCPGVRMQSYMVKVRHEGII